MSVIKQFIRYFLILMLLCVLPVFVYADETASLRINANLTTGTHDGTFNYSIKEIIKTTNEETGEVTTTYNEVATPSITTNQGIGNSVINNLKPNTEYQIVLTELPEAHEFVSLESETKIITNTQKINVTTGESDSLTVVDTTITSNGTGIETNKETNPIINSETNKPIGTSILSLSVTGRASTTSRKSNANILVIYDTSSSMLKFGAPDSLGNYYCGARRQVGNTMYYNDPPLLYKRSNNGRFTQLSPDEVYTGTVYYNNQPVSERCSILSRADIAEKTVYDFVNDLFEYKTEGTDNIEMAYITFAGSNNANIFRYGTDNKAWTSNKSDIIGTDDNPLFSTDASYRSAKQEYASGTNWEAALRAALTVVAEADDDPTYVIFVTDGQPFNQVDSTDYGYLFNNSNRYAKYYYAATDEARSIQTYIPESLDKSNTTFYSIYAFGTEDDYLDDLTYFAYHGEQRENVSVATVSDTENYYNASDHTALNNAISSIFNDIVNTAGFSNVSIDDGTTSQVKVTSDGNVSSLLEVNPNNETYGYWLSMPVTADGTNYKLTRKNRTTGNDETITFTLGGDTPEGLKQITATWGSRTFNLEGTIENNTIKYKWTSNAFYDFDTPTIAPPAAVYNANSGDIDWDLSSLGKLINNVTYTVDVEVWPSQYTQDLIADLMNHPEKYDTLDDGIKDYIVKTGDNSYALRTNTKALVSYKDSNDQNGTTKMNNPEPLVTNQKEIEVTKDWKPNEIDPENYNEDKYEYVELYLVQDDKNLPDTIKVYKNKGWKENVFVSMGIIKQEKDSTGNITSVEIIEKGHDFKFTEKDYHWNLDSPTMHPMLINGVATMLIKPKNLTASDIGIGTADFKVYNGKTYYQICQNSKCNIYELITGDTASKIHIENARRSNLNIKKEVIGDYVGTDKFTFTLRAKSSEALWFSIYDESDPNNKVNVQESGIVSGARLSIDQSTGEYYYVIDNVNMESWSSIVTVDLQENWNIRFTNVPLDTQVEVTESNIPANSHIVFENVTGNQDTIVKDEDNSMKVIATLDKSNKLYQITYTNRYLLTNVTVTKKWIKNNTETTENILDNITVEITPDDDSITIEDSIKQLTSTDETPWTYIWTNLPKYIWNSETNQYDTISYSVRETKVNGETLPSDKKYPVRDNNKAIIGRWLAGDPVGTDSDSGKSYTISNTWLEAPKTDLNFAKIDFSTDLTNINTSDALSTVPTLEGAIFKLYRYQHDTASAGEMVYEESDDWKLVYISGGNGRFVIPDLYAGEYRLVEIETPDGYILPGGQWKIVITEAGDTVTVSTPTSIEHATAITHKEADNTYYVYNEQVPELPETGARGIIDFSLIGLILMTLASFILIVNQKEKI